MKKRICSAKIKHVHKISFVASVITALFAAIGFSGVCCTLAAWGLLGAGGIAIAAFFTTNQLLFLILAIAFLIIGLIFYYKKKTCNNFK